MVIFRERSLIEKAKRFIFPAYKARKDKEMFDALLHLCNHPKEPCVIGAALVMNDFGSNQGLAESLGLGF